MTQSADEAAAARRHRTIGAVALLVLAGLVLGLQLWQGRARTDAGLDTAFAHLAAAVDGPAAERQRHLAAAEGAFARSAGVLAIDAQALLGLGITGELQRQSGATTPPPAQSEQLAEPLDEAGAIAHARSWLALGRPEAALVFLEGLPPTLRRAAPLRELHRFAAAWQAARQRRQATSP